MDVNAPFSGQLVDLFAKLDDLVQVGKPLFVLDTSASQQEEPNISIPKESHVTSEKSPDSKKMPDSQEPSQSNESSVKPISTGPVPTQSTDHSNHATPSEAPTPKGVFRRNETRVKLSPFMTRTAQRVKDTQNDAAILSTFQEVQVAFLKDQLNSRQFA